MVSFGLIIEHNKSEIFYFSRIYNNSNPELDLSAIGASTLEPKTYWRYLGFYFYCCLFFKKYICYYSTKVLSTVKAMNVLKNLTRGLPPLQKWLLYCSYIITINTYSFQLQFFTRIPAKAQILLLAAMQYKAAFWILGVFYTSPTGGIKALSDFILIYLHLKKLAKQSCLRTATLSLQYTLIFLPSARNSKGTSSYSQSLALLSNTQCACLKSSLLDTEVSLLNLTKYFNLFDTKAIPGCRLLDSFPNHISFHLCNCSSLNNCIAYLESLDCICLEVSFFSSTLIIVNNASAISPRNMQVISAVHF